MSQQENSCPVMTVKLRLEKFYNDDSKDGMCSKCHPCKLGIYDAIKIIEAIQAGNGSSQAVAQLKRIATDVKDGGMCKKGKDHADVLAAFLQDSAADLQKHIKGVCHQHVCSALVTFEINPDKCTMCDACRPACKEYAIEGQKMVTGKTGFTPYRIRQKRCSHCGACLTVCPEGAIEITEAALVSDEEQVAA